MRGTVLLLIGAMAVISMVVFGQHAFAQNGSAQTPPSADVRAMIEGTFQVAEWHLDGKVLRPPQAMGRLAIHDGQVSFMLYRDTDGTMSSVQAWGVYSLDDQTYSYSYDHYETMDGPTGGPLKFNLRSTKIGPITLRWDGPKLIATGQRGDHREYERGRFLQYDAKGLVRVWERMH